MSKLDSFTVIYYITYACYIASVISLLLAARVILRFFSRRRYIRCMTRLHLTAEANRFMVDHHELKQKLNAEFQSNKCK